MVFTLEDMFVELDRFYYYSIRFSKKGERKEKQYDCILTISLAEVGEINTRTFEEISLSYLFQSIEGFISEMKRKKEVH